MCSTILWRPPTTILYILSIITAHFTPIFPPKGPISTVSVLKTKRDKQCRVPGVDSTHLHPQDYIHAYTSWPSWCPPLTWNQSVLTAVHLYMRTFSDYHELRHRTWMLRHINTENRIQEWFGFPHTTNTHRDA